MSIKSKFCSECDATLEENDRFCAVCGAKVVDMDEQNHEKSSARNASRAMPPKKSKPKVAPYVSSSSVGSTSSPAEESHILPSARFSYRIGAMIIDWALVVLIGLVGFLILDIIHEYVYRFSDNKTLTIILVLLLFLIPIIIAWYYTSKMEASKLQTSIGKYLFGLKVTNKKGVRCSFGCTSVRFIGKLISLALGGLGYLMIAFTRDKQALHDKLANTFVVEDEMKVKFMKKLCQVFEEIFKVETK